MSVIDTLPSGEILSKVLEAPGPLALDFYAESYPPCRALGPRLELVAEEYANRLPVYRLDAERDFSMAESFGVTRLPTVLIFRGFQEAERLEGPMRMEELSEAFERAIRG